MTRLDRQKRSPPHSPLAFDTANAPVDPAVTQERSRAERRNKLERLQSELAETEARSRHQRQVYLHHHEILVNMSHELRTPLNAIIGFADLLREEQAGPVDAQQKDFLDTVAASGRGLLAMINDVLDLARLQAGMIDLHPAPIDLEDVFQSAIRSLRGPAAAKQLKVESIVDPTLRESVTIDGVRLRQALRAFLANAIRFAAEGGTIAIRARAEKEAWLRLEVVDGAGIDRMVLQHLSDGRRTESRHGEVDLGLALARGLIEAMGGRIESCSAMCEGSVLSGVLPCRPISSPAIDMASGETRG
jgi:two-component system cell cycle sensor histidine kinase PleC